MHVLTHPGNLSMETVEAKSKSRPPVFLAPPQNGLAGLKHWRQDMLAALVVALVSVPLSLGIALASGAPPICGLTSEIVAGLIFPFLGGSYVSICGPAAGLAPVLFTAITDLGGGDMDHGYHIVLCVIMLAGFTQIILTWLKAAKFSRMFPMAAIHGMLAAIGFLLFSKQIPNFVGSPFHAHEFFPVIFETPSEIATHLNPSVFSIGIICLLLLFQLTSLRRGPLKYIPPQLTVVVVGAMLGHLYHLDPKFLVKLPDNLMEHGFAFPDFQDLVKALPMLPHVALFIFMLTFVDGTESLATVQAVDRIDPFHRKSDPDRTLFAMGISNICSSMIGGLTIIPGIIKSTTCIVSGGRTAWVNFYNAIFLIAFLLFAGGVIRTIPIAALAAVLMHIGYKLAGAHKWRSMIKLGGADLAVFSLTIFVTLVSDLMLGIGAGMLLEAFVLLFYAKKAGLKVGALASSPIQRTEIEGEVMDVYVGDSFHCFNSLKARGVLDEIPEHVKRVVLHCQPSLGLIDHSTRLYLATLRDDMQRAGKSFEIEGLDQFKSCGSDSTAFLYRQVPVPQPQTS